MGKKDFGRAIIVGDSEKLMDFYVKNIEFINELREYLEIVQPHQTHLIEKIKNYLNEIDN